jgi:hypothetical protein
MAEDKGMGADETLVQGAYHASKGNSGNVAAAIGKGADKVVDAARNAFGQLSPDSLNKLFSPDGVDTE